MSDLMMSWANGCDDCEFGLVMPPSARSALLSHHEMRRVQARRGELTFCDCQAGIAMRRSLLSSDAVIVEKLPTFHGDQPVRTQRAAAPPLPSTMRGAEVMADGWTLTEVYQ